MPSMRWLALRWHTSTDALAIAGAGLLLINSVWLAVYLPILLVLGKPQACSMEAGGGDAVAHRAVVWGLLAFLVVNILLAGAMLGVGLLGTPLEPSKRRWMGPVMYAQLLKWLATTGFIMWCITTVYRLPPSCWKGERRGTIEALLNTTVGVFVVLGVSFGLSYNALAGKDPAKRWEVRLKRIGRLLGCYKLLTQAPASAAGADAGAGRQGGDQEAGRGVRTPLYELSRFLARGFGAIDVEKSDILTGLMLATVMIRQQRRAAALARLRAAGVRLQGAAEEEEGSGRDGGKQAAAGRLSSSVEAARRAEEGQQQADGGQAAASGCDGEDGGAADVSIPVDDSEDAFWAWLRGICAPPGFVLEPPSSAAEAAPHLSADQLAAACCECASERVPPEVLREALHWVWHAVAAYGQQGLLENAPHPWLARLRLYRAVFPRSRPERRALPPVQEKIKASRQYAKHYISGKQLLHYDDQDIVYLSFADSFLGAVPYGIVLDRQRRAVVLTFRDTASMASLLSDLSEQPQDMTDWLPPSLKRDHPDLAQQGVYGHEGIFSAARAVLADLNRHQMVHILLTGECRPESAAHGEAAGREEQGEEEERRRTPEDYRRLLLEERGLDCRGWSLVLTGHSLGAGIAGLLTPHFADWWPVVVSKDSVSRTSSVNFERLQDQVVVALARCRVSKLRVLLRGRSAAFKRLPEGRLFHPPDCIPEEALGYLRSYFAGKQAYKDQLKVMEPPGRCLLVRRLRAGKGAPGPRRTHDAVWVDRRLLLLEGILPNKHQLSDHYTKNLTTYLEEALEASDGGRQDGESA